MNHKPLLPSHIAVVTGNHQNQLLYVKGYEPYINQIRDFSEMCVDLGIQVITVYMFSAKHWLDSPSVTELLSNALCLHFPYLYKELHKKGFQIRHLGTLNGIPECVQSIIEESLEVTKENRTCILNLAFNYGSRDEILDAIRRILEDQLRPSEITEDIMMYYLNPEGNDLPHPDLIIFTGKQSSDTNFFLWKSLDAVLYETNEAWIDFNNGSLLDAIKFYRERILGFDDRNNGQHSSLN